MSIKQYGRFLTDNSVENSDISSDFYVASDINNRVCYLQMAECSGLTCYDSTIYSGDATISGPTWLAAKNRIGSRLHFDGVDDKVIIPHSSQINVGAIGQSYSIEFMVKVNAANIPGVEWQDHFVIKPSNPLVNYPYSFIVRNIGETPPGGLEFRVYQGPPDAIQLFSTITIADGLWHHIVGVRDASNKLILLYIDGVFNAQTTDTTTLSCENTDPAIIGTAIGAFTGFVDEFSIYNIALSAQEIDNRYKTLQFKFGNRYLNY